MAEKQSILILDSDLESLETLQEAVAKDGYREVLGVTTDHEALNVLRRAAEEIYVLILCEFEKHTAFLADLRREHHHAMGVLAVLSAGSYPDASIHRSTSQQDIFTIGTLTRPFAVEKLLRMVKFGYRRVARRREEASSSK